MSRAVGRSVVSGSWIRAVSVLASVVLVAQFGVMSAASASAGARAGRSSGSTRHAPQRHVKHRRGGVLRTKRATHQASTSEQFTPVSHTVTRHGKTTVRYFGAPTFRHTRHGWVRLNARVTRHRGAFPLRADATAAPTWFGRRAGALLRTQTARGPVTWSLAGGRNVRPRLGRVGHHRVVTYRSIRPGVDLRYELSGGRVKEALLLRSAAAARSFTFRIHDSHHLLGAVSRDKQGTYRFDGSLPGGLHLTLPAPTAWSVKKARRALPGDGSARMRVRRTHSGYVVRLGLDARWAAKQSFPVVLDPSQVYTWPGGTLSASYAPIDYGEGYACATSSDCPLSSTDDGSAFTANQAASQSDPEYGDYYGPIGAVWHADLSNIPTTTQIDSASFTLGDGPATDFWGGEHHDVVPYGGFDDCFDSQLVSFDADPQPGDAWADLGASTDAGAISETDGGLSASGYPLVQADVTTPVRHWVQGGIGSEATLAITKVWAGTCERHAAASTSGGDDPTPYYLWGEWWYDPTLTITYSGAQLPPALPVKQAYGCDCRWGHGSDRSSTEGDPVNTALGDSMETTTDVSTPGRGVSFAWRRTYNGDDETDGPLGVGWTFEYDASLSVDSGTGEVTFRDPTGGQSVFTPQLDGSYQGAPGVTGTLAAVSGGGWTLTSQKGEVLGFDAAGEEVSDTDATGHGETLAYTGTGAARRLHTVTDDASRAATLAYGSSGDADGRLVSVTTAEGVSDGLCRGSVLRKDHDDRHDVRCDGRDHWDRRE